MSLNSAATMPNQSTTHRPTDHTGDDAVRHLAGAQRPPLRVLDLSDREVTDAGVAVLTEYCGRAYSLALDVFVACVDRPRCNSPR